MNTLINKKQSVKSEDLLQAFEAYLQKNKVETASENLGLAANHILGTGGKRIRPILLMHCGRLFEQETEELLPAALAVEFYHNSTLIHDDIMDKAELRRGVKATHILYGINTAINAGNLLTSLAFQKLSYYSGSTFEHLQNEFNRATTLVIEGQNLDMDFESRDLVTKQEYLKMIAWKTSVLLGAAASMGAITAGVSRITAEKIYEFGLNLGISFQLKDDYLDAFGDMEQFGKKRGGDILQNKKTLLFIESQIAENGLYKKPLKDLQDCADPDKKITETLEIFDLSGARLMVEKEMEKYYNNAVSALEDVEADLQQKLALFGLAESIYKRNY